MKILAIEKENPGVLPEQFAPHLVPEARRVWDLYQAGSLREIYFNQDRTDAILILECPSREEAIEILNSLPLVRNGLVSFDVIPLVPYPGFSRLFAEK